MGRTNDIIRGGSFTTKHSVDLKWATMTRWKISYVCAELNLEIFLSNKMIFPQNMPLGKGIRSSYSQANMVCYLPNNVV
jgi:hypothetical protein